jgi:hypothetical protein
MKDEIPDWVCIVALVVFVPIGWMLIGAIWNDFGNRY